MFELQVVGTVEALGDVTAFVTKVARAARLSGHDAYRLRLASEELFVNIVKHGYGGDDPQRRVALEGAGDDEGAWIRFVDSAAPFDPFEVRPTVGLDLPLQDREPGALGLYLVRQAVDGNTYEYIDGTNRSTVEVSKSLRQNGCDADVRFDADHR